MSHRVKASTPIGRWIEVSPSAVAEWIQGQRAVPVELPEFYSGLFYYYQPLFHFVGAAWVASFGSPNAAV